MNSTQKPLVAIRTIVYNHKSYLRDYFEGVVMQKTNFPFVAVVHDDCSTDGSTEIIKEYADKYPDIIKPIFEKENQWHKHDGSLARIMNEAIAATNAKYVAICEGDDYWTDPYKLQKQVDFMETHPDFSICFTRVKCLMNATGEMVDEFIVRDMLGESTIADLAHGNYIHTPSVLFRTNETVWAKVFSLGRCVPSDYVWWMLFAETGKIWKFEEPMAVYRVGSGIWSTSNSVKNDLLYLCTLNKLYVEISDEQVRANLQDQINSIVTSISQMEKNLHQIRSSKAYRLGKLLLKPFRWMKRARSK